MEGHGTDRGMEGLEKTLVEREVQHGSFRENAVIEDKLRAVLELHGGKLSAVQKVAVGRIMMKLGRIMSGGHRHSDTWHDIAGYAALVEQDILDE